MKLMAMFHLLKIRTSIDIFKNEKCKVTFGLEYIHTSINLKRCRVVSKPGTTLAGSASTQHMSDPEDQHFCFLLPT